jgi:hypothetical protein
MKKLALRVTRKTAHISNRVLTKSANFTKKVEGKSTRILYGIDYSLGLDETIPFEKMYYNNLKYILPVNPALPKVGQKPSVVLFLPSLNSRSFYGGTATAIFVAARLAILKKMPLHIIQTLETGHVQNISTFLHNNGIEIDEKLIKVSSIADRSYNVYGYLPMCEEDIFIASAWWDAHLISQLPLNKKYIYLIQDFEPIFYNNSDLYVLAEQTYNSEGFVPLCNTKLMYDFMIKRDYSGFKNGAFWFEPAVSRASSGLSIKKEVTTKKRIFLYGRPDVHRNLFFTAVESIDKAFKNRYLNLEEWDVFMAGQDKIPNLQLSSGVKVANLGKMSMDEYIKFSKTVDLAVSLMMAPHPNYPTLEFASIGTSVVTTEYANKKDLSNYSKNIIVSKTSTDSLSKAIKQASSTSYNDRIKAAKNSKIPTSWSDTLDNKLIEIIKVL